MASKADPHAHNDGSSTRAYTVEQKAAVLRVRKCGNTDYYDILGLEEKKAVASDGEIKKAYRKLSLLTHPDKNGYAGADEAFKKVSRAFQVLSDPDKKSKYDKFGGDPESRFSGASASGASPFSGFASQRAPRGGGGGSMFDEEISPEELFRQFFGGGGGGAFGGPFGGFGGGGNGFVFNMGGGPGVRVHQMGGGAPRRRPHNHANQPPASPLAALQSLLPLLLLFIIPLLSSLFSGGAPTYPSVHFDNPLPPQTQHRVTRNFKVDYYVNPAEVKDYNNWKNLDYHVEEQYKDILVGRCNIEVDKRRRAFQAAQGFWTTDEEKLAEAKRLVQPSCKRLERMGYRIQY